MAVEIETRFQQFCAEHKPPGAQCAVIVGDELIVSQAFGMQDVAAGEPLAEADRIGLHCTAKTVWATVIALLVEDGYVVCMFVGVLVCGCVLVVCVNGGPDYICIHTYIHVCIHAHIHTYTIAFSATIRTRWLSWAQTWRRPACTSGGAT